MPVYKFNDGRITKQIEAYFERRAVEFPKEIAEEVRIKAAIERSKLFPTKKQERKRKVEVEKQKRSHSRNGA